MLVDDFQDEAAQSGSDDDGLVHSNKVQQEREDENNLNKMRPTSDGAGVRREAQDEQPAEEEAEEENQSSDDDIF